MLETFANWLSTTSVSAFINETTWLWPAAEVLHFVGLSVLVGVSGAFDLRLLGLMRGLSIRGLHDLMPWATAGFAVNLVTGIIFFVGTPLQYVGNVAFYFKMLFILVAGVNALLFEFVVSRHTLDADTAPPAAQAIAVASLATWLLVLYCGRMLAFVGDGAF